MNQPLIPGLVPTPGLPALSPLGLIAPRLSFLQNFQQLGGFGNLSVNLPNITGVALPRLAPVVGIAQNFPPTPQNLFNSGLGIVSPRAAVGVQLLQGYQQNGGGRLFGRRCR